MRFLCLHGAGTNGEILEIQIGGLRQRLHQKGHQFHFVNGKQSAKVEEELEGIVDGPFYNHYSRGESPASTVQEAFEHTKQIIASEGPFDGVLGFSQGAALAASLIVDHSKTRPTEPPLFRVAVLICGAEPWEPNGLHNIVRQDAYPIGIPTANIVGKLDHVLPQSMKLFELCEPSKASFYDHGSKHMVPFDVKNTDEMVLVIEEAIAKA